ncbi:hypothetical protein M422DRAFT_268776 [Sphaerobolus stellatus SS14]|uniref:Uncharacterized protein n=1 Tax=Sphaerobolus stellatus (strain SS14) TaxID=990650 RepID=A0A0C9TJE1_SPHS4|nr:hypothetical protein M422DRAFT_268776 [Sphaerobolus stellatus SS14]
MPEDVLINPKDVPLSFSDSEGLNRVYGEINTGDAWHYYQSVIGPEETVNPAILASDATHVTNFSGDGKPNRHAFLLLCYLPVCKFGKTQSENTTQAKTFPGCLKARLIHACLKIVLKTLKDAGRTAVPMVNFCGEEQMNRVFLSAWIADKEEQNLLAALGGNSCTTCEAETDDLGDSSPCQPCQAKYILKKIAQVKMKFNPSTQLWDFIKECQNHQLGGVDEPFWDDLPYTDICKVICHDTLHGLHKAFKDHTAQWNINCITPFEIDNRISKISVQSRAAIRATRAELDFIYHAGWKSLGDDDLQRMEDFNKVFHENKHAFVKTGQHGGREQSHFKIPKVHARHHYRENILLLGAPYNYSTEISEHYHIEIAKKAYKATNQKDYVKQMLVWLTRQEKIYLRDQEFDGFLPQDTKEEHGDTSGTQQVDDHMVDLEDKTEYSMTDSLVQSKKIVPVI